MYVEKASESNIRKGLHANDFSNFSSLKICIAINTAKRRENSFLAFEISRLKNLKFVYYSFSLNMNFIKLPTNNTIFSIWEKTKSVSMATH